tara:strand:- start:1050 stop:1805 length:756 start_codon:yes stop_codon:yes gene_type:complete
MKSHKGNKKKGNNRTRKFKHSAKLIKLDDKGTSLVILKKNTPKSIIKKLFKNIDKNDYIDLCKEMTVKKKKTIRKRGTNINRRGRSKRYIGKGGGSISGPLGTFITGGNFVKIFLGSELFFLLGGASLATMLYAFKKVNLIPEMSEIKKKGDDHDYINEKLMKAQHTECSSYDGDDADSESKSVTGDIPEINPEDIVKCSALSPVVGTTQKRKTRWLKYKQDEKEAREDELAKQKAEQTRAENPDQVFAGT